MCIKDEICVICGKVFKDSESDYDYGDFYCNECFDKTFKQCSVCEYVYPIDQLDGNICKCCNEHIGLSQRPENVYKFKTV